MKPFVGPEQPAMPLDWRRAASYCAWAGKRLPSEWEWEKAARGVDGELFPWGDEPPSCERAQYRECAPFGCKPYKGLTRRWDCPEHNTKPVGTYPAGHFGIHDMAGNGYEWTQSAGVDSVKRCGAACLGRDPRGRCDGAFPCAEKPKNETRVLRGGSWYWPKHRMRGSHRRVEAVKTGGHRLGVRCAATTTALTSFPPRALSEERPEIGMPERPGEEALAAFRATTADPIEDKKICDVETRKGWLPSQSKGGRSEITCRDPYPYLESNEARGHLWAPYLESLGGGYLGVGSDQNFSYIALARSEWAWLIDHDPRVVNNHRRLRELILASATPDEFVARFAEDAERSTLALLEEAFADDPERARLKRGFVVTRERLAEYFENQRKRAQGERAGFGWLRVPAHYERIRTMFAQGRIAVIPGDMMGDNAIQTIAAAARALEVPIRVYYTSNAPTAWGGEVTAGYRRNVLALPFDARSVVLQTTNQSGGLRKSAHYWHHNVQWGRHLQERMALPGFDTMEKILFGLIPTEHGELTVLGMPGRAP